MKQDENFDFRETLYTISKDGRRRWVYTDIIRGFFYIRRNLVALILLMFYLTMPWITIGGQQGILLDIAGRKFVFFGTTFWATDTRFLFLTLGGLVFSLFFFTAIFGRIWCGWACPETVFLEFLYRPIETLIEGNPAHRKRLDEEPWNFNKIWRKGLKYLLFCIISWYIASTFLAYFLGKDRLIGMISGSPLDNLSMFILTITLTGVMVFQFGSFREQFCTIACPYARFQSVLLDQNSILVGYDKTRGEPRGRVVKGEPRTEGDCIDCGFCVRVCPTGIDIRNGLQLECIQCAACADACDFIMPKMGKPKGLIRYDTEVGLAGGMSKLVRPRVILYAAILTVYAIAFWYLLSHRALSEFHLIRSGSHDPFSVISEGVVSNKMNLHVSNKNTEPREYRLEIREQPEVTTIVALTPLKVAGGDDVTVPVFFNFPKSLLSNGRKTVTAILKDDTGFTFTEDLTLVGPE